MCLDLGLRLQTIVLLRKLKGSRATYNHHITAVTGIEKPSSGLGILFMILHEIANDQIGVNQPSLAHRRSSRPRAASPAASRICAKDIFLPLLLASHPSVTACPGAREW